MEPVRTEEHPRAIPAPDVTISSLIEKVAAYGPEGSEELLAEAYAVAHAAHVKLDLALMDISLHGRQGGIDAAVALRTLLASDQCGMSVAVCV